MRFEPAIDRGALRAAIEGVYGIAVRELTFVPVGFTACYEVRAGDGARYFLKVWPQLRLGEAAAEDQRAGLEFSRALHDGDFGVRVVPPVPARDGEVWANLDGAPLAMFAFLEGQVRGRRTEAQRRALGEMVAALQRATPALRHLVRRGEAFEIAYEAELRRHIEEAAAVPATARPGAVAARDWIVATRAALEGQLGRLHGLRGRARELDCPRVVCHMDLHGGNVLVDAAGDLHILDWDDVRLAPPEFDLWFGLESSASEPWDLRALFEGYRAGGGMAALHLDHFAFYLLRRDLEDIAIALARLLDEAGDRRDDEMWARGLHEWGTVRWSRLDEKLAAVAAALGEAKA